MKKGFTLIELLAVIIILAIIAIIAMPIVINIINDSKTSSDEQTVELYIDSVKKAIARKQLEESSFNPSTCTIQDSGNLLCGNVEVIVDMKGHKPSKGIIEIKENKLTYKNLSLNGKLYNKITELVLDNNNNGNPDIGDKYIYKVNDTDTFNFYVLSFNDNNTVNLIMDRNICNDGTVNYTSANNYCRYAWHDGPNDTNYGPDTAMINLYNGTKKWINVPDMLINYQDEGNSKNNVYGYIDIVTNTTTKQTKITGKQNKTSTNQTFGNTILPLKARLPKYEELINAECTTSFGSCSVWLMENMTYYDVSNDKYSVNNNNKLYQNQIYGYWTLCSWPNNNIFARTINYKGSVNYSGAVDGTGTNSSKYGVRPVITVPINYLSN